MKPKNTVVTAQRSWSEVVVTAERIHLNIFNIVFTVVILRFEYEVTKAE